MRITTVIGSLGCGGAEHNLLKLSAALAAAGHEITLLTLRHDIEDFFSVPASVSRQRVDPAVAHDCRWFDLKAQLRRWRLLRRALLATRPQVVVSFIDTNNVTVLLSLLGSDVPVVVSERSNIKYHHIGLRWRLLRIITYPFAAAVVVQTRQAMARSSRNHWGWRLKQISNWIEPPEDGMTWLGSLDDCARRQLNAGSKVVAVGRLHKAKGFDLLIRAFEALPARHSNAFLIILGDGPERSNLQRLVADLRLNGRVLLRGMVTDPQAWMVASDLFVLSSRYEGFPTVLAEAMAAGCPVISTACPDGPSEMIRHGLDGLLVPPEDVAALAAAMDQLLGDEVLRSELARSAMQITQRYGAAAVVQQWVHLLEDVVIGPLT
jgi:GalNAc-alpha-(1->4)-GalNAc-alpha-(1->3)-diNAcBac-PP-undecaprenol alpha-1,4-N-acetyl-D-galactosaminyltransferase